MPPFVSKCVTSRPSTFLKSDCDESLLPYILSLDWQLLSSTQQLGCRLTLGSLRSDWKFTPIEKNLQGINFPCYSDYSKLLRRVSIPIPRVWRLGSIWTTEQPKRQSRYSVAYLQHHRQRQHKLSRTPLIGLRSRLCVWGFSCWQPPALLWWQRALEFGVEL